MQYSYSWLKQLTKTKKSAQDLADLLTMHSFEVEGVNKMGKGLEKIVVGEILEITKHPNADKLQIATVLINSDKKTKREIICGAPNIKVGQKVPVALMGAKLPNGLEIKKAKIRGVVSRGMLCAEDELGLGEDHEGILILDENMKVGRPLAEALGFSDTVIEIDILPNRAHDCLSHVGVAREICALEETKLNYDWGKYNLDQYNTCRDARSCVSTDKDNKKDNELQVEIKDPDLFRRYIGVVMKNITVKESPEWLKNRLRASGLRAINNIVDATNYVMLELGNPLHAFDINSIANQHESNREYSRMIFIRQAADKEHMKLLDGVEKELTENDLVIADEDKILALAGVMGGEDSGINENTKDLVLEVANFDPVTIRKTRTRLGLKTESSDRFEKDIDPNLAEKAMARLIELIKETAGGEVTEVVDSYPKPVKAKVINLNLNYVNNLLGVKIPQEEVVTILNNLGLKTQNSKLETPQSRYASAGQARNLNTGKQINNLIVQIPTYRLDLETQEDLIEEIGRVYGYSKIKPDPPQVSVSMPKVNEERIFERKLKDILVGQGFSEMYNYSFYSQVDAGNSQFGSIEHLEVKNPVSLENELLRVSLIPNLLKNSAENLKNYDEVKIFEIGKVYLPQKDKIVEKILNPQGLTQKNIEINEKRKIVGLLTLDSNKKKNTKNILKKAEEFYTLKGLVDDFLARNRILNFYYDNYESTPQNSLSSMWHQSRSAEIRIKGTEEEIGFLGEINPLVLVNFDIQQRIAAFEIDFEKFYKISEKEREYQPISKYPTVYRDISLVVPEGVLADEITRIIEITGGNLILDSDLFDAYFDSEKGFTSFAFRVVFGSRERTLESKEVDKLMDKISEELEKELGVEVRKQ